MRDRGKPPAERASIRRALYGEGRALTAKLYKVEALVSPPLHGALESMHATGLYGQSMPDVVREILQRAARDFLRDDAHLIPDTEDNT